MRYIALEEAFSIPELTDRQPPPWPANRFSQRHLADWARKLPDFTGYRLPEMDAAGIDVQVLSLTVPACRPTSTRRPRRTMPGPRQAWIIFARSWDLVPRGTTTLISLVSGE